MPTEFSYDSNCDFCAIARGEAPETAVVWQDDTWMAFFPIGPATPGHTLVIPRSHVADLWDLEPPLDQDLIRASIKLGRAIRSALKPDGLNLITSSGKSAEQTVFHLHIHLLPRWKDDGFDDIWANQDSVPKSGLAAKAEQIREAYIKQEEAK